MDNVGVFEMSAYFEIACDYCCNACGGRQIFVDCFEHSYVNAINIDGFAFNPLKKVKFLNQYCSHCDVNVTSSQMTIIIITII